MNVHVCVFVCVCMCMLARVCMFLWACECVYLDHLLFFFGVHFSKWGRGCLIQFETLRLRGENENASTRVYTYKHTLANEHTSANVQKQ